MTDRDFWLAIYKGLSVICAAIAKYKLGKDAKMVELEATKSDSISAVYLTNR